MGTIVLVKEDDIPLLSWSMGRMLEVQRGSDGEIRVAIIQVGK